MISVPVEVAVSVGCQVFISSSLSCRVSDLLPVGEAVVSQTLPQFVTVEKDLKKTTTETIKNYKIHSYKSNKKFLNGGDDFFFFFKLLTEGNVMLLVRGWRAQPLPCRGLGSGCPSTFPLSPWPSRERERRDVGSSTHGWGAPSSPRCSPLRTARAA